MASPKGVKTRPTSDRAKESLFSALFDVDDARVLDLYCGTGALGLEALSRGAAHCTFVEQNRAAVSALKANLSALEAQEARVVPYDVTRALKGFSADSFDLVLADPPYDLAPAVADSVFTLARACLAPEGRLVWEHRHSNPPPDKPKRSLRCGEAAFSFY